MTCVGSQSINFMLKQMAKTMNVKLDRLAWPLEASSSSYKKQKETAKIYKNLI